MAKKKIVTVKKPPVWYRFRLVAWCWFMAALISGGIIFYSALYAERTFPNFMVAFIFMFAVEAGLVSARYISVLVDERPARWYEPVNILIFALFLISVIPATLGTQLKRLDEIGADIPEPVAPRALVLLREELRSIDDQIKQDEKLLRIALKGADSDKEAEIITRKVDYYRGNLIHLRDQRAVNVKKATALETEYDSAMNAYRKESAARKQVKGDLFNSIIEFFYLKILIVVLQSLNIWFALKGSQLLRRIREEDIDEQVKPSLLSHEKTMDLIKKHTEVIVADVIKLNGELEADADVSKILGK